MMSQGPGISQLHQRLTGNRMQGQNVAVGVGPVGVGMGVTAAGTMMQQGTMAGQRPMVYRPGEIFRLIIPPDPCSFSR
jgi:hypothetical protein